MPCDQTLTRKHSSPNDHNHKTSRPNDPATKLTYDQVTTRLNDHATNWPYDQMTRDQTTRD
jgi:hypothetical protein